MSEEELQNLKQKLGQIETDCQVSFDNISSIAANATKKEEELNNSNAKLLELVNTSEASKNTISGFAAEAANINTQLADHGQKAAELLSSITSKSSELESQFDGFIKKPNETELSKLERMSVTYQKLMQDAENIDKINAKLKEYELLLFGNKEAGTIGLKDQIENHEAEVKKKKAEWEESYAALFKKIEGLLPGATSTGLSTAYQDQGKKYNRPYWIWSSVFVIVIAGMVSFAIYSLHDANSFSDAVVNVISRAPFFVPTIWLAIFASKQQSQNRRLQEEYAHKEALTKSYESYKREIEKLPDSPDKTKILEKLVDAMVNMAKENPSKTLQMRHHNDRPPLLSGLFRRRETSNAKQEGQDSH